MRKKILLVPLILVLLVLPLAARWFYYYDGRFEAREIPRPALAEVSVPTPETAPFADRYTAPSPGVVLVDLAHENRFDLSELGVLRARLSARGQRLEPVETPSDLQEGLRYAKALVVISPGAEFQTEEVQQIERFVEKGGRLLLVTDPTRFDLRVDDFGNLMGLDSDVVYANDLAARFGLVFQADYLYNMIENEGNFRNIKLTDLARDPLTEGVEQVVFYATHSILSEEPALMRAGPDTRSSEGERTDQKLAVAVLAADGAVLALGDLSFVTEPHNAVYDNDRFIANVADFLGGVQRRYELADFPSFFDPQVDLIYADDPLLDSDLLLEGGDLQTFFADSGRTLSLQEAQDGTRDTLFLGLYTHAKEVDAYLAAAGVTLLVTPTERLEKAPPPTPTPTPTPTVVPTIDVRAIVTGPVTTTLPLSPTVDLTGTLEVTPTAELTLTAPFSPALASRVEITSVGQVIVTGTALILLQGDGQREVLVVLAHTETGLGDALERLTRHDFQDCLLREMATSLPTTLALCPTGEIAPGAGMGGWERPGQGPVPASTPAPSVPITDTVEPVEPVGEPEGRIIVVSFDDGEGRYDSMTSAQDYQEILASRFEVTVWRTSQDGPVDNQTLLEYDMVIWTTGDFEEAIGEEESEAFFEILLEGIPLVASGAFFDDAAPRAVQRDIQVDDADHPLARGFEPDQVIEFVPSPSGVEYEVSVMEVEMEDEMGGASVFVRGPDSESSGAQSVLVIEEELTGLRMAFIGFPLYLLPEEAKTQLVLNVVDWMLAEAE